MLNVRFSSFTRPVLRPSPYAGGEANVREECERFVRPPSLFSQVKHGGQAGGSGRSRGSSNVHCHSSRREPRNDTAVLGVLKHVYVPRGIPQTEFDIDDVTY